MLYTLGIDVGSTTVKVALFDEAGSLCFKDYRRHNAKARESLRDIFMDISEAFGDIKVRAAMTGSAGLGISTRAGIPFVQEVVASTAAIDRLLPGTDAVIELGGEDAKILFFGRVTEQRMNGTCAGGTGAFIDQMATLMDITVPELNELAKNSEKIYPVASRCGVFAKSDIQPLLNQGARKEDIAASVLQAVVGQTIAGLAQGRKIQGNVAFLGGPLAFLSELRRLFTQTLGLTAEQSRFPENAQYFVAIGCAFEAENLEISSLSTLISELDAVHDELSEARRIPALFKSENEYRAFQERHARADVHKADIDTYSGDAYLGIDAGSTTTKLVLLSADCRMLYSYYAHNKGNPVQVLRDELLGIRRMCGDRINIRGCAVTGYGEELMVSAFGADIGVVETVAHYRAARFFNPDVDYIIDIGGQDMKCFRVRGGAIDSIMLNEACSSGCGSFIETFAKAIGHSTEDFAKLGLYAEHPADLGSRCTVFMNSSVKQAQKEGATVMDIAAGLSVSIVKNALYKVIRVVDPSELGKNIVVQGGTFINDAILRAFELELGTNVTRPNIAGLMGAFGCALLALDSHKERSGLLSLDELAAFEHSATPATCGLCGNRCTLTVNRFSGGRKFITGNKCERGAGGARRDDLPNMYEYKYKKLLALKGLENPRRGVIGLPMALNFFDTLPFWNAFFSELGIRAEPSSPSSRELYHLGQDTIPSDTACYPAKLVHGHIMDLISRGIDKIFYPISPYNLVEDEKADNFYNCPVVAYYPELIAANVPEVKDITYIAPYVVLYKKSLAKNLFSALGPVYPDLTLSEVRRAAEKAKKADRAFRDDLMREGKRALAYAREHNIRSIVLAGRPYHIDPEVNHAIDRLICSLGLAVLTEEAVAPLAKAEGMKILNQWSYHTRMYNAAAYVAENDDLELCQLVSFGCGIDAITGDEIRDMLESKGRLYTQIKIDEITNLGAAKIRLRSLIAAMDMRSGRENRDGGA